MSKQKYQVCERNKKDALPVDWNKLPEEIFDEILPEFIYNVMSLDDQGFVGMKSVVYFRPVKRFGKDVYTTFEVDELEFGV